MGYIVYMRPDNSYRLGRCNSCPNRMVYVWPANSGLRLDDVRCPRCKGLLDRTSRDAHLMRHLSDEEVSYMRQDAVDRMHATILEYRDAAQAWEDEMTLYDPDSGDYFRCELNANRYNEGVGTFKKALARLEKGQ